MNHQDLHRHRHRRPGSMPHRALTQALETCSQIGSVRDRHRHVRIGTQALLAARAVQAALRRPRHGHLCRPRSEQRRRIRRQWRRPRTWWRCVRRSRRRRPRSEQVRGATALTEQVAQLALHTEQVAQLALHACGATAPMEPPRPPPQRPPPVCHLGRRSSAEPHHHRPVDRLYRPHPHHSVHRSGPPHRCLQSLCLRSLLPLVTTLLYDIFVEILECR